jgi:hypothetical protein
MSDGLTTPEAKIQSRETGDWLWLEPSDRINSLAPPMRQRAVADGPFKTNEF